MITKNGLDPRLPIGALDGKDSNDSGPFLHLFFPKWMWIYA
jgi:hypothetical protein